MERAEPTVGSLSYRSGYRFSGVPTAHARNPVMEQLMIVLVDVVIRPLF